MPQDIRKNSCSSLTRDTVASCPIDTSSSRTSTYGEVSEREIWSTSSASQSTLELDPSAPSRICTRPRYEVRPPPRATDLEMIELDVCGAACTILAPAVARLVTRLYTLFDQFWMVVYRTRAFFFTMISTTAECSESLE